MTELDEILTDLALYLTSVEDKSPFETIKEDKAEIQSAKAKIQALISEAVIDELKELKRFNGSYIGIDGKRVDDMLHHSYIDKRIATLKGATNE